MVTTKANTAGSRVFVPTETFVADIDGVPTTFHSNLTRVREGHPLLQRFAHLFEEIRVQYEWEQATRAPGEARQ